MSGVLSDLLPHLLSVIGVGGFSLYVLAYGLLTFQIIDADSITYFALSAIAAGLVLISLIVDFNLASALIQIFWIAISVAGIVIRLRKPKEVYSPYNVRG